MTRRAPPPAPPALPPPGVRSELAASLVRWYRAARRDLPWRRTRDPYAIWVSEVMLQQTQAAAVVPYFQRWMARFPTVRALADADEHAVLHAWQGLGYYSRARYLRRGAAAVLERHAGRVPERLAELLALPGVGRYTAGAVASIAYNRPEPVVDGNVVRVLTRLFTLRGDPARAPLKEFLWELAAALIPDGAAAEFNPALMELGATVCRPANPRCGECPVASSCRGRRLGVAEQLPETAARPRVTAVRMAAALAWRQGRLLLARRREEESRWAGMWQFPSVEVAPGEEPAEAARRAVEEACGLPARPGPRAALVRHSVTRYRITLEAYHLSAPAGEPEARGCRAWCWASPAETEGYALPSAHRKIARAIRDAETGDASRD